jgi:phosphoadenosine phosphosulfate reductase
MALRANAEDDVVEAELSGAAERLETEAPAEILAWAAARFSPRLTFATGFGPEGLVILDLISRHHLAIDVFTLDTGLLFPETYALWRRLESRYGLTIRAVKPQLTVAEQAAQHGERLWDGAPDQCCAMRKMAPLREELKSFDAWITAIRRDQTGDRADARVVERDPRFGLLKINPLARFTHADVWDYIREHDVPVNPLHAKGYPSIGCWPCTTPIGAGEDLRAGRWRGREKTECGLHARSAERAPAIQLQRT